MAGLDNITNQIIADAEQNANEQLEEARQAAEKIIADAKDECQAMEAEAAAKEVEKEKLYESRGKSSAEQQRRTALLRAKQEIIQEVIDEAYATLKVQSVDVYFDNIEKLIRIYAFPEDGEIYFSKEDLLRMPTGFEKRILDAAKSCGGTLKLMKESRPISDGFVMVYGGIEENCTLKALIDAKKDELQDKVNRILFA